MPDDINPTADAPETPAGDAAGTPEATPAAEASKPAASTDWKEQVKGLSAEELQQFLEEHPQGAAVKERLGQSHADKVLLKDRDRIAAEVRKEIAQKSWDEKWNAMTPYERVQYRVQQEEAEMLKGRVVSEWWPSQVATLKEAIPELKAKDLEAFNKVFEEHPSSWGATMAAFIDEVSKMRNEAFQEDFKKRELPKIVEAEVKGRIGKTLAGGDGPDLRTSGPGHSDDNGFVGAYARGETDDHKAGIEWLHKTLRS